MLRVEAAKEELASKSYRDIQIETTWKWASRAAASYENVLTAHHEDMLTLYLLAEEFFHEAVEHAALAERANLVEDVRKEVLPYRNKAMEELEKVFGI